MLYIMNDGVLLFFKQPHCLQKKMDMKTKENNKNKKVRKINEKEEYFDNFVYIQ